MTLAYRTGRAAALTKLGLDRQEAKDFLEQAGSRLNDISLGYTLNDLLRGSREEDKQKGMTLAAKPKVPKPPIILPWFNKNRATPLTELNRQTQALNAAAGYPGGGLDAL